MHLYNKYHLCITLAIYQMVATIGAVVTSYVKHQTHGKQMCFTMELCILML